MKTQNILDKLEKETTISDNTVIEDTEVSTQRVLDMVKQEIGSTRKVVHIGKKRRASVLCFFRFQGSCRSEHMLRLELFSAFAAV